MRWFRRTTTAVIALAALAMAPAAAQASDCTGTNLQPTAANVAQVSAATLCLINEQRAIAGLPALARQGDLDRSSSAFAELMVDQRFFAHESPDGHTLTYRLRNVNYIPVASGWEWTVGENIGWAEYYLATPAQMVKAWMASSGHRANILSRNFSDIGVGIDAKSPLSAATGATYVTDFGRRTYHEEPLSSQPLTGTSIGQAAISHMGIQMRILLDRRVKLQLSVRRLAQPGLAAHTLGTKTLVGRPGNNAITIKRMGAHRITTGRYRVTIKAKGSQLIKQTVTVTY